MSGLSDLPELHTLALCREGGVLYITLTRPEVRNAMNLGMVEELYRTFLALHDDLSVRAVVLRGADGHFCAGGDVKDLQAADAAAAASSPQAGLDPLQGLNRAYGALLEKIDRTPQVVVVVVEGFALGGGLGLVCVSDIALTLEDARFGMPEVRLGLLPAQIAPFVVRRIGLTQGRRLALTGILVDGREACRLGLVHEIFSGESDCEAGLEKVLAAVRLSGPKAVAASKALLHRAAAATDLKPLLDEAAREFAQALRGEEARQGMAAFLAKREPSWTSAAEDGP